MDDAVVVGLLSKHQNKVSIGMKTVATLTLLNFLTLDCATLL